MKAGRLLPALLGVLLVLMLGLIWWGWQRGGLALLQLGMGVCYLPRPGLFDLAVTTRVNHQ